MKSGCNLLFYYKSSANAFLLEPVRRTTILASRPNAHLIPRLLRPLVIEKLSRHSPSSSHGELSQQLKLGT